MLKACRTCLIEIQDTTYINLNDDDGKPTNVREELSACIPELDLNLVKDPVICQICVKILQLTYCFRTQCLRSEKQIGRCIRSAKLNGKPITLTKLFRFSRKTGRRNNCSRIDSSVITDSDDVSSDPTADECLPAQRRTPSLDIEVDTDEHEDVYVTNSDISMIDEGNVVTNSGAITELNLRSLEFQENSLRSSSIPTEIKCEISQDFHNEIDCDFIKEEHELTVKTEIDEVLSFKEENYNNTEEERSDDCKTGTWNDVKEETRSSTDDAERYYDFPAATRDCENFEENNSKSLDNQIEECYASVRRLSTDSNYSYELYSHVPTSSDVGISEQNVSGIKKRRVNYEEGNSSQGKDNNVYIVSRNEILQEMSDTDEGSLTKEEDILKTIKPKEPLNEEIVNSCRVAIGISSYSIKASSVDLQESHLGNLMNKSSCNANELRNSTSAKSLQPFNKKPESARRNGSKKLQKHKQVDSTKKSFYCEVCKYSTTLRRYLVKHMQIHTSQKKFHCNVCGMNFTHKQRLIIHMRTHTGEKPFECNICDYRAIQKRTLKKHMQTHSSEKLFHCNNCDYGAVHKQNLIIHMQTHTGDKPHHCTNCDYRAARKQNLIKHMGVHTGIKPYKCELCDYKASQKQHLMSHMRTHTGEKPFKCNFCEYKATKKDHLNKHIRTHTGEKPFRCFNCDYQAAQKQHLIIHMRTHAREKLF